MRNFKKFLTLVLAVMMVVSSFAISTSAATKFTDVPADNEYLAEAVDLLSYVGIAKGVSETEFGTEQAVTRQQFALFIYRLMKGGKDAPATGSNTTRFEDLKDPTYFYAISWANSQGIVNGRDAKTFDPEGVITLQEGFAMLVRALGYAEDGELAYPYQTNEIAEQKGVELDEGLDSSINYTDALTRGDMAIMLYNAFFAETGEAEIVNKEKILEWEDSNGDLQSTAVLISEEVYPTLAEKAFDVVKVVYDAVATPHYAMTGYDVTDDLGYPAILFELNEDETDIDLDNVPPSLAYLSAEDIGLETEADLDDNFMAEYTLYVTLKDSKAEKSKKEIDAVLFADSALTRKTVNDFKFETVTTNKKDSYFDGTDAKVLSGKVTSGTDVIYFYDAPYSYANPVYGTNTSDIAKYIARNEYAPQFISFELTDVEDGYYEMTVEDICTTVPDDADESGKLDATELADATKANAVTLVEKFEKAYYNGLYEAELIDVDGDGLVDYINYKEYSFFQVTTDEDYDFYDDGVVDYADAAQLVPVVAINGAEMLGENVADEDYVIGYYDQANNVVGVAEVVKPTTATIKTVKGANVVLADNTTLNAKNAWKLVNNYNQDAPVYDYTSTEAAALPSSDALDSLLDKSNIGEDIDFYVYDGVVLYQEGASSSALKYTDNLIIPEVMDTIISQYDAKYGAMVYYAKVYVDGKEKTVALNVEDSYPSFYNTVTDVFCVDAFNTNYANQLCVYSVDADGFYTIESLENNLNEDGDYLGINSFEGELDVDAVLNELATNDKDDEIQFIESELTLSPAKITGTRYTLDGAAVSSVTLKSFTQIIVKNYKFDEELGKDNDPDLEVEYLVYGVDNFDSVATELTNASMIVSNDTTSRSRENLVLLYGEADNFEFVNNTRVSDNHRIVSDFNIAVDENGYYRNYYTLLDPFTGSKVENVAGSQSARKSGSLSEGMAPGTIVELTTAGLVSDKSGDQVGNLNNGSSLETVANLVWIREYNAAEKVLDLVPVDAAAVDCWQDVEEFDLVDYNGAYNLEDYQYNDNSILYSVTNATKVVMIRSSAKSSGFFKWGAFSALTVADLAEAKDATASFNTRVLNDKNKYETGYAKYLKAYIELADEGDEEDMPTVSYIIVIAHGDEVATMLDTHTNSDHEECADIA